MAAEALQIQVLEPAQPLYTPRLKPYLDQDTLRLFPHAGDAVVYTCVQTSSTPNPGSAGSRGLTDPEQLPRLLLLGDPKVPVGLSTVLSKVPLGCRAAVTLPAELMRLAADPNGAAVNIAEEDAEDTPEAADRRLGTPVQTGQHTATHKKSTDATAGTSSNVCGQGQGQRAEQAVGVNSRRRAQDALPTAALRVHLAPTSPRSPRVMAPVTPPVAAGRVQGVIGATPQTTSSNGRGTAAAGAVLQGYPAAHTPTVPITSRPAAVPILPAAATAGAVAGRQLQYQPGVASLAAEPAAASPERASPADSFASAEEGSTLSFKTAHSTISNRIDSPSDGRPLLTDPGVGAGSSTVTGGTSADSATPAKHQTLAATVLQQQPGAPAENLVDSHHDAARNVPAGEQQAAASTNTPQQQQEQSKRDTAAGSGDAADGSPAEASPAGDLVTYEVEVLAIIPGTGRLLGKPILSDHAQEMGLQVSRQDVDNNDLRPHKRRPCRDWCRRHCSLNFLSPLRAVKGWLRWLGLRKQEGSEENTQQHGDVPGTGTADTAA